MSVKNFVQCGLVTPVAPNTTELVLVAPTASYQYPPLDGGTLVIADSVARPTFYEIISYTHRIDNVLYGVVRAKEGTTARAWVGTTWIYQALTAQDYVDALALKAPLASPALTGVPTAPTAPLGTNTQQIATMAAVQAAIANLIASSPAALDTLNELAAALGNDPNFATTMNNALAGKEPSIAAGTSAQMWLGNKTWASVLTQVQNTLLTGLGAGSNATILTTDTLIGALAKIQNQLNNKANFTDSRLSDAREWTATEVSQAEAEAGTATIPRKWSALRVRQAVLASTLTGLNLTVGTAVTATDTVLVAIGKLQKQISDAAANLAGSVRATVLTGYVSGSNVALASSDTVLAAFGKVQAQITALATSKLDSNANAVSAAKLATARSINGVAFDGTANITVADATKLPLTGGTLTGALNITNGWKSLAITTAGIERGFIEADTYGIRIRSRAADTTVAGTITLGAGGATSVTGALSVGGTITGNGSGLTALDAASLASGIVPDARLSGTYTGVSITGNAATATQLQTARTIALSGDVTGSGSFDGTGNLTINAVVGDDSHNHTIANVYGLQSALDAKAPLSSPALTGVPTAPTNSSPGTNNTQVATTAFVQSVVNGYLSKSVTGGTVVLSADEAANAVINLSGTLTSALIIEIPVTTNRIYSISNGTTGAFTTSVRSGPSDASVLVAQGKRNLIYTNTSGAYNAINDFESIALSGVPTAPTAAVGTSSTQVATTAFVNAEIANDAPSKTGTGASGSWEISVTGNAGTATKLATARTIGGVSFDGSANINLPGVNTAGTQSTSGNAATATKLATARTINGVAFDGSANITVADSTKAPVSHTHTAAQVSGLGTAATKNITISTAAPSGGADGDLWIQY